MNDQIKRRLAEIKERAEKATEGPWALEGGDVIAFIPEEGEQCVLIEGGFGFADEEELRFIAHSRTDIPFLLTALETALNALEWNAHTICMDDIYKHENNEQNKINLLRNIREALAALTKIAGAAEGK